MKRTLRRLTLLLAVPVIALSFVGAGATPATAQTVGVAGVASISLDTTATISGNTLTITATGSTVGQLIDNTSVVLTVAGVEQYTDSSGNQQVAPIVGNPSSVSFTDSTSVTFTWSLNPGSTVQVNYAAEVAGLLPTGALQCVGEVARVLGGGPLVFKTC